MQRTRRDAVWSYVLTMTYRKGKRVNSTDVAEVANVSERTARDTLHVMEEDGFLERRLRDGNVVYQEPTGGF